MEQKTVYVGVGSNLGDKLNNCLRALSRLSSSNNCIEAVSSFYKTEPVGFSAQDWFINGVAQVITRHSPQSLLTILKNIEEELGRVRTVRWGPRIIDLDILLFGTEVIKANNLVIPHPRLHERQFVLVPLAELSAEVVHPILKKTVAELLRDMDKNEGVVEFFADPPPAGLFGCGCEDRCFPCIRQP